MICFCDTSALVKLYVREPGSEAVKALAAESEAVAACRIAWAEFHAAVARHARDHPRDQAPAEEARQRLAADWPRILVLEVTQRLVERAGELADAFALRGYDAVQLAAAAETWQVSGIETRFACFDRRLNRAARLLGLTAPFDPA